MQINDSTLYRFWAKVDTSAGQDGCWLWTAAHVRGYGSFGIDGKQYRTNRLMWMMAYGPIPDGMFVCHNCPGGDNSLCVNPAHLWLGTAGENTRDAAKKGQMATGDRNGARVHVEAMPRGDGHYARTQPERLMRGESHGMTTLTAKQVLEIRARCGPVPVGPKRRGVGPNLAALAREYHVDKGTITNIMLRKTWRHLP